MNKLYFRFISTTLAIIGLVVGFSAKVIAQYGAPPVSFRINGKITSKDCNVPIPNIQLSVTGNGNNYEQKFQSTLNGDFLIRLYDYDSDYQSAKELTIVATDVDGAASGGTFATKTFKIKVVPREPAVLNLQLDQLDTPPCKTSQKTPIVTKDTVKIAPIVKRISKRDTTKTPVPPIIMHPTTTNNSKNKNVTQPNPPISGGNEPNFKVYPNPNHGSFVVEFSANSSDESTITITNDLGSIVYSKKIVPSVGMQKLTINVDNLVPGTYFFSFIQNATIVTRKIVIV